MVIGSKSKASSRSHCIIVGGGWAGLAAACQLAPHMRVTVLEAAPQLGGRARSVFSNRVFPQAPIDNGQHLCLSAYTEMRALFDTIGLSIHDCFYQMPFEWHSYGKDTAFHFKLPSRRLKLPKISLKKIRLIDKFRFLSTLYHYQNSETSRGSTLTVEQILTQKKQSFLLLEHFWKPLCEAAMTTSLSQASATSFHAVIRTAFNLPPSKCQFWIPKRPLGDIFPLPAQCYIEQYGGTVLLNHRVKRLIVQDNQCIGVDCEGQHYPADNVILATSFQQTQRLLSEHPSCHTICNHLSQLIVMPISTLYLQFPQSIQSPHPLFYLQTLGCWVFDRTYCGQPGLFALVFSVISPQEIATFSLDSILSALRQVLPSLPDKPLHTQWISEKRAAFETSVDAMQHRPTEMTPFKNVFLTGDYVKNDYPACLEGAMLNAKKCSARVLGWQNT